MGGSGGGGSSDVPANVEAGWNDLAVEGHSYQHTAVGALNEDPFPNSPYLKDSSLNMVSGGRGYGSVFVYDDIADSFFGVGLSMTSYDSVYGMFKEFLTDVDVIALYNTIASAALTNSHISTDIAAESAYLDDEINQVSLPKVNAGMRDINAVMTTGFTNAKAILEAQKLKMINKYSAGIKSKSLDLASTRWSENLKWNIDATTNYMQLNKLYWLSYYDNVDANIKARVDHKKWPFTILDFQRSFVGAAAGAGGSAGAVPTQTQKAASGAMAGASAGATTGNPYVTLAGAIVGGVAGYYS